jgi:beta-ribofuranosylaminobenzene 5'-phosphate synthase
MVDYTLHKLVLSSGVKVAMGGVRVVGGSRLHAGFYFAGKGRPYSWGGAGFYVSKPRLLVEARFCGSTRVNAPGEHLNPAREALKLLGVDGVCVEVIEAPPQHTGLGSTTQVMLGVACAVQALEGTNCTPKTVRKLALFLGRGKVSGVGTLAFAYGGFVADAGTPDPDGPRLLLRHPVPEDWRFVIAVPELPRGISEDAERVILSEPWDPPRAAIEMMSRGFLRLSVGIARGDLQEALEGLRELQTGTGLYFSKYQGGSFRRDLQLIVAEAWRDGMVLAQSSWGPALYTINTADEAPGDASLLRHIMRGLGLRGEVYVVEPLNSGARVGFM